jgi:hypothetical protein
VTGDGPSSVCVPAGHVTVKERMLEDVQLALTSMDPWPLKE